MTARPVVALALPILFFKIGKYFFYFFLPMGGLCMTARPVVALAFPIL